MVLYRKYRPQNFDEIRGQRHIKAILQNALHENKVAHAYLFSGSRGVGKTSVARILARELGVHGVDLIEIDAASHRGIDDIRELRETVQFQPNQSPVKVYILDEAHMLTQEAFNALLKILEEPPNYIYFVLCTTEVYKIPMTVVSRCQHLQFVPPQRDEIIQYLEHILHAEGLEIETELLNLIADNATNSYRDATVALESTIRYLAESEHNPLELKKMLGLDFKNEAQILLTKVIQNDRISVLRFFKDRTYSGFNWELFLDKLIELIIQELINGSIPEDLTEPKNAFLIAFCDRLVESKRRISHTNQLAPEIILIELLKWMKDGQSKTSRPNEKNVEQADMIHSHPHRPVGSEETNTEPSDLWPQLLVETKKQNPSLEMLLRAATPASIHGDELAIKFKYDFHRKKFEQSQGQALVEQILHDLSGRSIRLKYLVNRDKPIPISADDSYPVKIQDRPRRESTRNDDLISVAQEVFGGELIE